ncbi:molybdate ABC transporter substrate-binding protein [Hydrogenophaga sp.]|uniref:molybdate ABC transporter substrate-binding protein n=1 Tax=Hydrogenophaga sp. TaxID=1904254 RepID=UPI00356B1670
MPKIKMLSGGAVQGLVAQLQESFLTETGCEVECVFDAVGAIKDGLVDGDKADLVALTDAQITQMGRDGHVVMDSARILGVVKTGVAVRKGDQVPDVSTSAALEAALLAAEGIYIPDPEQSTAGAHILKVLSKLGIDGDELAARLHIFPNGEEAMAELAKAKGKGLLGCIQTTEIRFAPDVVVAGLLPGNLGLATIYTVAVTTQSSNPVYAAQFISKLIGPDAAPLRMAIGFEA